MFGDDQTVTLTNAVTLAAAAVVEAHTQPRTQRLLNFVRIALLGRPSRDDESIHSTRQALAAARRNLVDHTRRQLAREDVDLFALPIEPDHQRQLPGASLPDASIRGHGRSRSRLVQLASMGPDARLR